MKSTNEQDEKSYGLIEIKSGLRFYYDYIDKINPYIFTEEKFPVKRGDIIVALSHLENISQNHQVFDLVHGHPILTHAIESIENFKKLDSEREPSWSKFMLAIWLENLLFVSCLILYRKFVIDYQTSIKSKTPENTLKILIEQKAFYKNNSSSYPSKYLNLVDDFIEVEIEKNKSLLEIDKSGISKEANELLISYLNQINESNESNDLYSSLRKSEFENFIFKFKRLLFIPSYFDITKADRERVFHIFLLGILEGRLNNYKIKSNKESGFGRYDICLNPNDKRDIGVIIEIKKVEEDSKDEKIQIELASAINQMQSKNYLFELREDNVKKVILISIVFNGLVPNLNWILNE